MTSAKWREEQAGAWAGFLPVRPYAERSKHFSGSGPLLEGLVHPKVFFLVRGLGGWNEPP